MKFASRPIVLAVLLAWAPSVTGCYQWVVVPPSAITSGEEDLRLQQVRFGGGDYPFVVEVHRVDYPVIEGWSESLRGEVRLNAQEHRPIEVRRVDGGAILVGVLATIGGLALTLLVVGLGVAAAASSP